MKMYIACGTLALALIAGCATETERNEAKTAPKTPTTFSDLPVAVQKTIDKRKADAKIGDIEKETLSGRTVYEITLVEAGKNRTLRVEEDGTVIKTEDWIQEKSGAERVNVY